MLDFDNIVLGLPVKTKFQPKAVLDRALEVGKIVYKRAYADWSRHDKYKVKLHELGFDLLEIPRRSMTGKNSADIRMVVDAMDLVISREHIDTFCLVTGDSDFTPLVGALRSHDKHVVGIGVRESSSKLLIDSCDEFVFYDELEGVSGTRERAKAKLVTSGKVKSRAGKPIEQRKAEGLFLLLESTRGLMRTHDTVWASMIKQTLVRKHPSFNEEYHGYSTFSELVAEAVELGILEGKRDPGSGNYRITGFGPVAADLTKGE
ncbi:MAG: NYN domain-containing protein [Planctomycetota bacterium]